MDRYAVSALGQSGPETPDGFPFNHRLTIVYADSAESAQRRARAEFRARNGHEAQSCIVERIEDG